MEQNPTSPSKPTPKALLSPSKPPYSLPKKSAPTSKISKLSSSFSKPSINPKPFLWSPLLVSVGITLTSSFFMHCLRFCLPFIPALISLPPHRHHTLSDLTGSYYIPGVFFSLLTGAIVDLIGNKASLAIFSVLSFLGNLLFLFVYLFNGNPTLYYYAVIYGACGSLLLRIPVKKIVANAYEGPNLATALNVAHNASHVAGILSGLFMNKLIEYYSMGMVLSVLMLISFSSVAFMLLSFSLSLSSPTSKDSKDSKDSKNKSEDKNKNKKKKERSLKENLTLFFKKTKLEAYLVIFVGCLLDSIVVTYKQIESYIFKELVEEADMDAIAKTISFCKMINLIGPFLSKYIIDEHPFRTFYLVGSSGCYIVLYGVYYYMACVVKERVSKGLGIGLAVLHRVASMFFYASWYPAVTVCIEKDLKATGLGLLFTVNSAGFVAGSYMWKKLKESSMKWFVGISVVATAGFVGVVFADMATGGNMNKKFKK